MSKKIIVTGGLGYIGSHTVVALHEAGYTPVIIDNLSNTYLSVLDGIETLIGNRPIFYQEDCCDQAAMNRIFEQEQDIAGIIHFAAFKAVGESVQHPMKYYTNNLNSLLVMTEMSLQYKVLNFVFSSSCTVYGQPDALPVTEQSPIKEAESPYGYTKQVGERILSDLVEVSDLQVCMLRYFNPIGAHPTAEIGELPIGVPNNLVPYITQTAAGIREKLTVFGNDYDTPDGTCVRDYIHVCDIADAHVQALKKLEDNALSTPYINLGSGTGNTVLEVIQSFEKMNNTPVPYTIGNRRAGDVEKIYANNSLAKKQLDWNPRYTLDDAMQHVWKWQQQLKKTEA